MIVGLLVVLAVAFNELRQAGRGAGKQFFPGALGIAGDRHPGAVWPACWPRSWSAAARASALLVGALVRARPGASICRAQRRAAAHGADARDAGNHDRRRPDLDSQRHQALSRRAGAGRRFVRRRAPANCMPSCGENGAGKSTLMKILSGVITEYEGETRAARPASAVSRHARRRSGRHQHHSPGTEPGRAALGRGQYLSGPRAAQPLGPARRARPWTAAAGELLEQLECQIDPRQPVGAAARRRSAVDRDRQGPVAAKPTS